MKRGGGKKKKEKKEMLNFRNQNLGGEKEKREEKNVYRPSYEEGKK